MSTSTNSGLTFQMPEGADSAGAQGNGSNPWGATGVGSTQPNQGQDMKQYTTSEQINRQPYQQPQATTPWGTSGNNFGANGAFDNSGSNLGGQNQVMSPPNAIQQGAPNGQWGQPQGQQGQPQGQQQGGLMSGMNLTGQTASPSFSQSSYQIQPGPNTPNPYLQERADAIKTQYNQNLQENTLPGLRDKFVGAGGLGGSRQGIAEGLAAGRSNTGMANAITNMYSTDFDNSQNRSLQGQIASMNAGVASQGQMLNDSLQRLNSERGFYSTNRGQDLQQMGLGASLFGQGNLGMINQGSGIYGLGQQEQNAPWQNLQNYNGILQPGYTLGGSQSTSGAGPSQGQSALGGAASGAAMGSNFGPWGAAIGGVVGGVGGYMSSDRRLKEDIKKVGKTDAGLNVYTYKYKGGDTTMMGVMAQEVEKKIPEAVGLMDNGYKAVNYGLLQ